MLDLKVIDWKIVVQWLTLLFTFTFSATVTFLGVTGFLLYTSGRVVFSLGSGMVATAAVLVLLYVKSPLTRGMLVAVPTQVIDKARELESTVTTIQK